MLCKLLRGKNLKVLTPAPLFQHVLYLLCQGFHSILILGNDPQHCYFITRIVEVLCCLQGHVYAGIILCIAYLLKDAHNLEAALIYLHNLANAYLFVEKLLGHTVAQINTFQLIVVKIPALADAIELSEVLRPSPLHTRDIDLLLLTHVLYCSRAIEDGEHILDIRQTFYRTEVCLVEGLELHRRTPGCKSLRRGYHYLISTQCIQLLGYAGAHTLTNGHHRHDYGNAYNYTKHREEGSQLCLGHVLNRIAQLLNHARSASTGLSLSARYAGYRPATTPITREKVSAKSTSSGVTAVVNTPSPR